MRQTLCTPAVRVFASIPSVPRAVREASVMANATKSPNELLAELMANHESHVKQVNSTLQSVQRVQDDFAVRMSARDMGAGTVGRAEDPEYSQLFASYARGGQGQHELLQANRDGQRAQINAAMSTTAPGEAGGYLAPIEWDRSVSKALNPLSPMRRLSRVIETKVRAYTTVWNMGGWGSGWVGETAARPETTSATLKPLLFGHGEIYAMPSVTGQLLDDADFPLEQWLSDELADTFATQENIAFIAGDGVNKPFGVLTYVTGQANATTHPGGAIQTVPTGNASALPDSLPLIDLVYKLGASYRQGASWLMNSQTASVINKLRDAGGNFIWRFSLDEAQPSELLGYPVEFDENMPNITAGALPILFGNFKKGYVINDRFGIRILRDPFTNKPYVLFYATKRVGGGLLDPNAFRALRVAAS